MYKKEALSALIAKIRENKEQGERDLDLLKETCMNACAYADLNGRAKVIFCFHGSNSEEAASIKAEKNDVFRRMEYNLTAVNAMAAFYETEQIFGGDPHSQDVSAFCAEFVASVQKTGKAETLAAERKE